MTQNVQKTNVKRLYLPLSDKRGGKMANVIWKKIAAGQVDPVYLLTGTERHIFDKTIDRLKEALPSIEETSIIRFDLEETPVELVIEEADTLPFLEEHKLIIASNAFFLSGQDSKKKDVEHNVKILEEWVKNPSPTATVVFIAPYEKLDGRKRITKEMRKEATVIEAKQLEGSDLLTWIQSEAQTNGAHIAANAAKVLVNHTGDQMLLLSNEIQKMATYLGGTGEIDEQLIEEMVPRMPEMDVFRLTDAYVSGNVQATVSIYRDLLENGEEPIMLTSLVAGQVRLMLHVQSLNRKGYHQQQIAKTLQVHPYRVKLVMENRNVPQAERLLRILRKLAEIDYKLKSTSGTRERLLELFFMEPIR